MDKGTRELKRAIDQHLAGYPAVRCLYDEKGTRLLINLIAPNGKEKMVSASPFSGDPHAKDNVLRDIKHALRDLNMALQGEDRVMASITQPKPRILHSLTDIGKASDLSEEVDTTPRTEERRGGQNALSPDVIAKAQLLRNDGIRVDRVCQLTGMSPASVYKHTRPAARAKALEVATAEKAHATNGSSSEPKPKRVTRLTHATVFKIGALLSQHCELADGLAVYAEGWDDATIAAKVPCTSEQVKEARIDNVGRLEAELPKRLTNPDNRELLKMIQGLAARVTLLEEAATKP